VARQSSGSGFIINRNGDVITNQLVVDGCRSVRVQHRESWHEARLVHSRARAGLAILKVKGAE
jgi:S1-C subfamily serine protease